MCRIDFETRADITSLKVDDNGVFVRAEDDGTVWLGFFAEDGRSGVLCLDKILACVPEGSLSRAAIEAWATDRRKQAAEIAG